MNSTRIILILISVITLTSCNSYKKLTYLQNIPETPQDSVYKKHKTGYKLQPADILYVRVITPNDEINQIFNPMMSERGVTRNVGEGSLYLTGYNVSDSGYVELPILDTVYVMDLTVEEAKAKIQEKANEYLKDAQVIVKLANFRFTVLGEVNQPGIKLVHDHQVNLMEALAYAGDISYNGNRQNILIIRPTKDGSKTIRVDVTNSKLISSSDYYIQPNDIIYVEPLSSTLFRERAQDYMFALTALTSVISTVTLIMSLLQ